MNLAALATLVAVIEQGSFAGAASRVGCTPSAVSLQMKQLEVFFGQPLFDRTARSARPTTLARELAAEASDTLRRLRAFRREPGIQVSGNVRLGAIQSVQIALLPRVLRDVRERYMNLSVTLAGWSDTDVLLHELRAGVIDIAIVVRPKTRVPKRLVWIDLYRQDFVLLAPSGAGSDSQELIRTLPWVGYDSALTGGRLAAAHVRRIVPNARTVMELRSIEAIIAMVSAGQGFSIVPRPQQAQTAGYNVDVLSLGRTVPWRQISLVYRQSDADSRNLLAIQASIQEVLNRPGNRGGCLVKVQRSSARRRGEYGDRVPPPVQEEYTRWTRADADGCTRRPIPTLPTPQQPWFSRELGDGSVRPCTAR